MSTEKSKTTETAMTADQLLAPVALSEVKTKKVSKKVISKLEIEYTPEGFVIWAKNRKGNRDYWLIDGSTFKSDGTINLGHYGGNNLFKEGRYKYSAKLNTLTNDVEIVQLDV